MKPTTNQPIDITLANAYPKKNTKTYTLLDN